MTVGQTRGRPIEFSANQTRTSILRKNGPTMADTSLKEWTQNAMKMKTNNAAAAAAAEVTITRSNIASAAAIVHFVELVSALALRTSAPCL